MTDRKHKKITRLVTRPGRQNALEAMAYLYRKLAQDVGATWERDSRVNRSKGTKVAKGVRDPWAS
jgi:hypothetical protein